MKTFLDDNFLLQHPTAERLYHDFARDMPVIDYHNHLIPEQIAGDHRFNTITEAWLYGDHYKWRAMRTHGIGEEFITGNADDAVKFQKWAETVPFTLRNPLYHWTHLELRRYFGITDLLYPATAAAIYAGCNEKLAQPDFSVLGLLERMNVRVVGTTDDPLDTLDYHAAFRKQHHPTLRMVPSFRPDKAMNADDAPAFRAYADKLEGVTGQTINTVDDYLAAMKSRHDFFADLGCRVSDHGLEQLYAADYTEHEIAAIFLNLRAGKTVSPDDAIKMKSALLYQFAIWDHEKGWVQQYHLGALRNNNSRLLTTLGPDTGFDSIGDFSQARQLSKFLNRLDATDQLARTILYNLNPADNEMIATMTGNFNDGSIAGKIQFGSGWWFLDQKDGMIRQLNALSNMGLLSRFVGMITDSRSFLSFPRHEYFRRILCNLIGEDVENGELPNDVNWLGEVVKDICYRNAERYFNF